MIPLIVAMLAFVGGHFLLSSGPLRRPLVGLMGERPFSGVYSVIVLALLVWAVIEFNRAPIVALWALPLAPLAPVLAMPLALIFLVCGVSQRNPTMVGARFDAATDPAPGILRVTRHPIMWSFALWGLAHIVTGGDVASLVFFGGIAALALVGMVVIDLKRRARDPEGYARFAAATSRLPFWALITGRARFDFAGIGWRRIAVALVLYVVLFLAHPYYTGAPVLPIH